MRILGLLSKVHTLLKLTRAGLGIAVFVCGFVAHGQATNANSAKLPKAKKTLSPWILEVSTQYNKPVKEESHEVLEFGLGVGYRTSIANSFLLNANYAREISQDEDESSSSLESLDLTWMYARPLNLNWTFQAGLKALAPVSEADTAAGFRGGLAALGGTRFTFGSNIFALNLEVTGYSYEYDTANIAGTEYNKKHSELAALSWSYLFTEQISWQNSASFFTYTNTLENNYEFYGLSSDLVLQMSKQIAAKVGISTNDRVITERKVLDDDNTRYKIALEWSL